MTAARQVLDGYAEEASTLIRQFEAISSVEVLAPIVDLLPVQPSRILEIGAGTGRDAAWLAERGHKIVAAEPVKELRSAGTMLHPSPNITWIDDRLPLLIETRRRGDVYDLVLLVAVWQHLRHHEQSSAISNLAAMIAPDGRLIISLRHGPGAPTRPCFAAVPEQVIGYAEDAGLCLLSRRDAASVQRRNQDAGVTWIWLCFRRALDFNASDHSNMVVSS